MIADPHESSPAKITEVRLPYYRDLIIYGRYL
jgi:hypothetical protein